MIRLQGLRSDCRWTLAMTLAAGLAFTGCSNSTRQAVPKPRHSTASSLLPSYSAAAELKPCESVSTRTLSSIIGKPVHVDKIGDVGERPMLSQGAVLPKIWVATCNWGVPAYPTLAPYLQIELTPSTANALAEFNGIRTKMAIAKDPVRIPGYGQEAVFYTDTHGDAIILILKGPKVITVELTATSRNGWSQPVEAIELRLSPGLSARRSSANTSAGVLNPSIARGRSFISSATA